MNAKCGEPRRARAATGEIQGAAGNEWSGSTSKGERASDAAEASVVLQILGLQASLDGPVERQEQILEPIGLTQQQGGPLVGGEAAGETDGEHARVEDFVGDGDVALTEAAPQQ